MRASPSSASEPVYVAGIGGSAGSIEAFAEILRGLDQNTGLAYIFVLHLMPRRGSALVDVLQRNTAMPVREAGDGVSLQADAVYVITPNHDLRVQGNVLRSSKPRTMSRRHHQVDILLESLAESFGARSIGVVLSGGDGDGAMGIAAIKFHGGRTFVQDASARIDSMPLSALETGCVDAVLAPAQIAAELSALGRHHQWRRARESGASGR